MTASEELIALLSELPLFASFDDAELVTVAHRCEIRQLPKGVTLWHAGEPGDEFLVVVSGELSVWGSDRVVARLGPGSGVGEIALLLGEPRSATVTVSRPTEVLVLSSRDFDELVRNNSRAVAAVGEMLSRRLQAATPTSPGRSSLIVAVVAQQGRRGASLISAYLRESLAEAGSGTALRVDVGASASVVARSPIPPLTPDDDWTADISTPVDAMELSELGARAAAAAGRYGIVVLDVSARCGISPVDLAGIADVVVDLASDEPEFAGDDLTRVVCVRSASAIRSIPISSAEPVVLPDAPEFAHVPPRDAARRLRESPHHPLARALGRLSRIIEGRVVGVALGAGAAFGLAHVGVLKTLTDAGVPVDVVAGSSMGAIVGLGFATGASPAELDEVARAGSSFRQLLGTVDLALTGDGMIAGRRLLAYLRPFWSRADTFHDLLVPARAVATDLASGNRVAIDDGPLDSAMRATIAMPPIIAPFVDGQRTLVDGGIADPVPCDVVRQMGADIVIGVNVVPLPDPRAVTVLTEVSRGLNRVNPFAYMSGGRNRMNVIDVLMNSLQVAQHQLAAAAGGADVWVRPQLHSYTWIDFYRAPGLIDLGAEAAEQALPSIQAAMEARRVASMPTVAPASGETKTGAAPT